MIVYRVANVKYKEGVMIFTQQKGGLMYEASIGGQKFNFSEFVPSGEADNINLKYTDSGRITAILVSPKMIDYSSRNVFIILFFIVVILEYFF